MTPEQSRALNVGDRVYWQTDLKDQGEVLERDWSGVRIKWFSGRTIYCHHNDMRDVERLPRVV